jgi:hypothetical protein
MPDSNVGITYVRNPLIPLDEEGRVQYIATELDKISYTLTNKAASEGAVDQLVAGENVTLDPPSGIGIVTINAAIPGGAGEANTTSNLGGGEGLALPKDGINLPFKSLLAGSNISLLPSGQAITIASTNTTFAGAGTTGYVPNPITEQGFVLSDSGAWVEMTGGGVGGDVNYEEGGASTVYSLGQFIDGGNASTTYFPSQIIDCGDALNG